MSEARTGFQGLRVLSLESRRGTEQATLITKFGGEPLVAPSLREIPLESETAAITFAEGLRRGEFDCVIFLTGVGTRALATAAETRMSRADFAAALSKTRVVARGPKPVAALRELNVTPWIVAPEPNTWRDLMAALDARRDEFRLHKARVAVQEYGVSNTELLDTLTARGAIVTAVPIYRWALPEDVTPLQQAVGAICRGEVDVIVLTSGVQLAHLWQIARELGQESSTRDHLSRTVIASIGPTTSDEIRRHGLTPDLEASHPKMGVLITEAAAHAVELRDRKRTG